MPSKVDPKGKIIIIGTVSQSRLNAIKNHKISLSKKEKKIIKIIKLQKKKFYGPRIHPRELFPKF